MAQPRMRLSAAVLGTPDPPALAAFYSRLLGWPVTQSEPDWAMIRPPAGGSGLSFQVESTYEPPVWPPQPGAQQMMVHLDIAVEDLEQGVAWAVDQGARVAEHQPQEDVRVMLDPVGHPFCLFPGEV
ncbi:MAG: VOC family protein [Chloroflexota bacterium]|nr:VOC family protein [Chloroflexota bacterium]